MSELTPNHSTSFWLILKKLDPRSFAGPVFIKMIDVIVLLIVLFFAFVGLRKGFWRYLLELIITAVSLLAAWYCYQQEKELFKSLLVFAVVFAGLRLFKWFFFIIRGRKTAETSFSFAGHLAGAILGFIWGTLMAGLFLLLLYAFPSDRFGGYDIAGALQRSYSSQILQRFIATTKVPILENITYISKLSLDEETRQRLSQDPQFQELLQHQTMKAIMEDPQTISQLKNRNFKQLLANPKIYKLLNDGQFINKLLELDFKKAEGE